MTTEHLSPMDLVRVLSFSDADESGDDRSTDDLEAHASGCPECTARLAEEAALTLAIAEAKEGGVSAVAVANAPVARSRRWRRAIVGLTTAFAVAAAVPLAVHYVGSGPTASIEPATPDLAVSATAFGDDAWFLYEEPNPQHYTRSTDRDGAGLSRALQRSEGPRADGFGTVMQTFSASRYVGRRVRFSANVRVADVDQWVGLWMRVDSLNRRSIAFDNMVDRPIRGTSDWASFSVVLDVADDATAISVGLLLNGSGEAAFKDPRVEIVDRDVPVTSGHVRVPPSDFAP